MADDTIKYTPVSNRWKSKANWQKNFNSDPGQEGLFPNLREEFHIFLYGSDAEPPRGFWIMHREMLLDQESEHWDPENQEVYRGYRWLYQDHLIRVRYNTYPTGRSNETDIIIGDVENPTHTFYMEHDVPVKKEDELIAITPFDTLRKPSENHLTMVEQYDIIRVDPVKGDLGRIEYHRVFARNPSPIGNLDFYRINLV